MFFVCFNAFKDMSDRFTFDDDNEETFDRPDSESHLGSESHLFPYWFLFTL